MAVPERTVFSRNAEVSKVLLQQDQRQVISHRIDPKIIMANSILQLTTMELRQTIEAELMDNPCVGFARRKFLRGQL